VGASNQKVTALIARRVRPLLRGYGFTDFTGRRAWFVEDDVISHVTLNAVGSYFAGAVGCTSYSLSVEAGVYYRVLDRDLLRPQDYDLTLRLLLGKYRRQALVSPDRPDIWFVAEDGQDLETVVDDAVQAIQAQALPGIDRFRNAQLAFQALLTEDWSDVEYGKSGLMLPGSPGSPQRTEVAHAVGGLVSDDPSPSTRSHLG
jgi:hypothetical protein